ncbi:MAG: hypothetical protein Q7U34_07145 [Anaerolineales bacterium]|nr:hypothetical protein [Anaerolineales bacterium]
MKPAVLRGTPIFPSKMGIVAPKLPALSDVKVQLQAALQTGQLTNHAHYVPEFERALSERLGAHRT